MSITTSRLLSIASTALLLGASVPPLHAQTPEENTEAAEDAAEEGTLPLITTRTLEFTTDRGTWISLDLSPDGETILFELLGDLYTLPIDGGTATRITSGQAYDMQPRYSPDGSRIVFVSDRDGSENLWIAGADGSDPEPLTEEERESFMSPEWTPEGDYVIAVKGSDLWLFHVDGGSGVQVTGHDDDGPSFGARRMGPAFGPD
ncbi:MAG: TolB family protein, partial [Acidobacteriota bacterium]